MARVHTALLTVVLLVSLLDSLAAEFDKDKQWACMKQPGTYPSYAPKSLCKRGFTCDCNVAGSPATNARYGKDCECLSTENLWGDYMKSLNG